MIIVIDNYDSFTFNLVQALQTLGAAVEVHRNDALGTDEVLAREPEALVLSPGPGTPEQAGICLELVRVACGRLPVLGVCLGHQAIAQAFGAHVGRAPLAVHGKASAVFHPRRGLYQGLPLPFMAGRYHSLAVSAQGFPAELVIEAETADRVVMGLRHREHPCYGVQFHPESILTPQGTRLLQNFLQLASLKKELREAVPC